MTDQEKELLIHKENTLFSKMFRINFSETEWMDLLNDWNDRVDFAKSKDGTESTAPLLQEWVAQQVPPGGTFRYITEKNGPDVWLQKNDHHESALFFLLRKLDNHGDKSFSELLPLIKKNDLIETIDRILNQRHKSDIVIDNPNQITGDMLALTYLKDKDAYKALGAYLKSYPEAITARHEDNTAGSILSTSRDGWNVYMENGGSPFDRVYSDPITGGKADLPLWQWLFQKKIYHPSMQKTLHDLLMRLHENREPEKNDYILSDDDWAKLVESKSKIVNEIAMIEFEKNIESDWKGAIKANKKWREWRSGEGGNFILWLCCKIPADFIRQAHKTKLNHPLMKQKDAVGRTFMHYLLTGSMTSNFGTYRRSSKVKSSQWPEMMKNIESMIDKKPERGMMADWLLSSGEAYFGALRSQEARSPTSSYDFNFLSDFFKANPEWFWAGVNGDVLSKIFESEQKTGMAVRLMGGIGVIFSEEQYKKAQENWNDADKFKFAVFMSHDQFRRGGNGATLEASYKKFFPNIIEQPVEAFTLQEVQQMLHWVKNQNNSYYKKTEETLQLIAYLEKANMMLKIGAPAQETKQAPAKRRM